LDELGDNVGIDTPTGAMQPLGYVVMQHGVRESCPVKAYQRWLGVGWALVGRWLERIPSVYRSDVLAEEAQSAPPVKKDPYCLALLKHYRSLMPLAMEAHKPMFFLRQADGAIGAHIEAVRACYEDFLNLSRRIADKSGFAIS
jgi:chromosome partitioning protein